MATQKPSQHAHAGVHHEDLADCGFGPFELAALDVSRRFFATFAAPQNQSWLSAFEAAERTFPPPFGATIALALTRAIGELRVARTSGFSYMNADCEYCSTRVTQEERLLISVLRAARQCRRAEAMTYATMVCEGCEPERLVDAFERLCIIIGEGPLATRGAQTIERAWS